MYGNIDAETEILTNKVIGAAIEVHRILGPGYLESVYEEALARELSYLKATNFPLGLLINFNVTTLRKGIKRIILT